MNAVQSAPAHQSDHRNCDSGRKAHLAATPNCSRQSETLNTALITLAKILARQAAAEFLRATTTPAPHPEQGNST
jgi:hypothetical protein